MPETRMHTRIRRQRRRARAAATWGGTTRIADYWAYISDHVMTRRELLAAHGQGLTLADRLRAGRAVAERGPRHTTEPEAPASTALADPGSPGAGARPAGRCYSIGAAAVHAKPWCRCPPGRR